MKALFIINPAVCGPKKVKRITDAVRKVLASEEGVFKLRVAKGSSAARALSKDAVDRGYDAVFACGGDGTVHEIATPLVGTKTALGIIPAGLGNGFAKSLGIPEGLEEAAALAKRPTLRPIDVGVICERYFFSTAGIGFEAHLNKVYNERALSGRLREIVPYLHVALFEFYRSKPAPVIIKIDNFTIRETPFILAFANTSRFSGNSVIAPGAVPDDGFIDIALVAKTGPVEGYRVASMLFRGKLDSYGGLRIIRAGGLEVLTSGDTVVHTDGEAFTWKGDISVRVLHKKLRVITGEKLPAY